jgi:hypothetical protein
MDMFSAYEVYMWDSCTFAYFHVVNW